MHSHTRQLIKGLAQFIGLVGLLLLLAAAAQAPEKSTPHVWQRRSPLRTKHVHAHVSTGISLYCRAKVVYGMRYIWQQTSFGTTPQEAAFIVNGDPQGDIKTFLEQQTSETYEQTVYLYPNTIAIFHVHPNGTTPFPSTPDNTLSAHGSDTETADKFHVDVYVVSADMLSVYYWRTKQTVIVRHDWAKLEECN
jgi:hypothetical protein